MDSSHNRRFRYSHLNIQPIKAAITKYFHSLIILRMSRLNSPSPELLQMTSIVYFFFVFTYSHQPKTKTRILNLNKLQKLRNLILNSRSNGSLRRDKQLHFVQECYLSLQIIGCNNLHCIQFLLSRLCRILLLILQTIYPSRRSKQQFAFLGQSIYLIILNMLVFLILL